MMIRSDVFGWFDSPYDDVPTYDPMLSESICPVCSRRISAPMVCVSIMKEGDSRSYFYRAHKSCYGDLSEEDKMSLDSGLIDSL